MDKQIAKMWVDALESGQYEQGKEYLCAKDQYCCLGVLCELYIKQTGNDIRGPGVYDDCVKYDNEACVLPQCVIDWAGIGIGKDVALPFYGNANAAFLVNEQEIFLTSWNDGEERYFGKDGTFSNIAAAIKKHWEKI